MKNLYRYTWSKDENGENVLWLAHKRGITKVEGIRFFRCFKTLQKNGFIE